MPTYEYLCSINKEDGGHGVFERFHSMRDDARVKECPMCREEKNLETPVERLISAGGRGVVELVGGELVEKQSADAKQFSKDVHSSEKLYANVLGEAKYESLQRRMDKQRR